MTKVKDEIKEVADYMDADAESANCHDFVGVHRTLAVVAVDALGEEGALKLFQAIHKELQISILNEDRVGLHAVMYLKEDYPLYVIKTKGKTIPRTWKEWDL